MYHYIRPVVAENVSGCWLDEVKKLSQGSWHNLLDLV